jgi:hypothetical protein
MIRRRLSHMRQERRIYVIPKAYEWPRVVRYKRLRPHVYQLLGDDSTAHRQTNWNDGSATVRVFTINDMTS